MAVGIGRNLIEKEQFSSCQGSFVPCSMYLPGELPAVPWEGTRPEGFAQQGCKGTCPLLVQQGIDICCLLINSIGVPLFIKKTFCAWPEWELGPWSQQTTWESGEVLPKSRLGCEAHQARGKHPHPHSSVILPETAEKTEQLTQQLVAFVWKELFLFLKKRLLTQRTASFALISSLGAVTSLLFSLLGCSKMQ